MVVLSSIVLIEKIVNLSLSGSLLVVVFMVLVVMLNLGHMVLLVMLLVVMFMTSYFLFSHGNMSSMITLKSSLKPLMRKSIVINNIIIWIIFIFEVSVLISISITDFITWFF